jgi:hypothetical protein
MPVRCYGQHKFHLSIKHYHLKYLPLQTQNFKAFFLLPRMHFGLLISTAGRNSAWYMNTQYQITTFSELVALGTNYAL